MRATWLAAAFLLAGPAWAAPTTPAPGPLRVIGTEASGCIAGAAQLPESGPGWQTVRAARSSFWGAPPVLAEIEALAGRARKAGLPDLYIGDIAGPRGGPLNGGHASHQLGIDADIYLDTSPKPALTPTQRETLEPASLVRPDGHAVDPARWSPDVAKLIRLAAETPSVERLFVNPAIKARLCRDAGADRTWLRKVRPWWGHASHMHIRFFCPAGQNDCHQGPPPPAGDGCDATLDWWFAQLDHPDAPAPPGKPPVLPAACQAIMALP